MSKRRSPARRALLSASAEPYISANLPTPPVPPTDTDSTGLIHSSPNSLDPERHSRKCAICHHPDRANIEEDFINWVRCDTLLTEYGLRDHKSLYRHARALGLDFLRRCNLRKALEPILEYAPNARPNADAIVSAARVYSHLNDFGQWQDPTRETIVTKRPYYASPMPSFTISDQRNRDNLQAQAQRSTDSAASRTGRGSIASRLHMNRPAHSSESNFKPPTSNFQTLIAHNKKLKSPVTPTKQRTAPHSNRPKTRQKVLLRPIQRRRNQIRAARITTLLERLRLLRIAHRNEARRKPAQVAPASRRHLTTTRSPRAKPCPETRPISSRAGALAPSRSGPGFVLSPNPPARKRQRPRPSV